MSNKTLRVKVTELANFSEIRYIINRNKKYLLEDDVIDYLRELAGSEETDVRNRLNQAASNIKRGVFIKKK